MDDGSSILRCGREFGVSIRVQSVLIWFVIWLANLMNSQKVGFPALPSFRRKPESSIFRWLHIAWSPVFTGVTTFYETVKFNYG
jgi:hypothetical protein